MPINVSWQPFKDLERRKQKEMEDTLKRLQEVFAGQEDKFGRQPGISAQDIVDYRTATGGRSWPKERLGQDTIGRMQQETGGGMIATNVPTEVVAHPMPVGERMQRDARQETMAKLASEEAIAEAAPERWGRQYDALGQFAEQRNIDLTPEDMLANIGIQAEASPERLLGRQYDAIRQFAEQRDIDLTPEDMLVNIGIQRAPREQTPEVGQEDVPPVVKQAQSLVMKFASQIDPQMAIILASNPALAANQEFAERMKRQIPPEVQPVYDNALSILQSYYQLQAPMPTLPQPQPNPQPQQVPPNMPNQLIPSHRPSERANPYDPFRIRGN